jgi:hypothetical protein
MRGADVKRGGDNLKGSSQEGIFATFALKSATRQAELTPWRTEPEIGPERQEQLTLCLAKTPDITHGIYPFKGIKLSRADVEWLLAAHFAYRAQLLQRIVLRRQGKFGAYLFSLLLDLLAGYGYRPGRSLMAYLVVIFGFMGLYLLNAHGAAAHLSWDEALVLSVSSFHGRGFFLQNMTLGDAFVRLAAVEAVLGLLIEVSFIATFTQRFFGK